MSAGMCVLVTGAGGFVCRHVVESLLNHGCAVIAVDQAFDSALHERWHERLHMIEADIEHLPPLPMDVDVLIHGAALTASPEEAGMTPENHMRANLNPMLAALEWAHAQFVGRSIFISSDSIYPDSDGAIDETLPARPLGLYSVAKATTEALITTLHEQYRRDVVTVRLSHIYGPGEYVRPSRPRLNPAGTMVREALQTGHITLDTPERPRAWTYAPDIGEALYNLIATAKLNHALYNLACEELLTDRELAGVIQSYLPQVQIREADAAQQPVIRRRGHLTSARLFHDTGFNAWTPFQQGIKHVIDWQASLEKSV